MTRVFYLPADPDDDREGVRYIYKGHRGQVAVTREGVLTNEGGVVQYYGEPEADDSPQTTNNLIPWHRVLEVEGV